MRLRMISKSLALILTAGALSSASWAATAKTADFNGDGYADLAVGAPGQNTGVEKGGAVHILYGTANGPYANGNTLSRLSGYFPGYSGSAGDEFGETLATGDFDADGYADLVVSVPGAQLIFVCYGSSAGVGLRNQRWTADTVAARSTTVAESFGGSYATGDFNGDGFHDLAIGAPKATVEGSINAGAVYVLHGSRTGLISISGNALWTQNTPGMQGMVEYADLFGTALAAGDFNGDRFVDLAIGVPGEDLGAYKSWAGAVHVLFGSVNGLTVTSNQLWTQDSAGILDDAENSDKFGAALATGNFGNSSHIDLAIGVPGESLNEYQQGAVQVLYGSANGLSAVNNQIWTQDSPGILGIGERDDFFGSALAAGDFGNGSYADLAIGVPYEDLGTKENAGAVQVLYGSSTGLTSTGNQWWSRGSLALPQAPEDPDPLAQAYERFGSVFAAANFGQTAHADLVIGIPEHQESGLWRVGAVALVYGSASGVQNTWKHWWTMDTPGIAGGGIQQGAAFGASLGR